MSDAIIVAIISGVVSLFGVIITNVVTASKSRQTILAEFHKAKAETEKAQAITDTKLQTLTDEVRVHNNFAQRIPVLEEQIKVINHRVSDLETAGK